MIYSGYYRDEIPKERIDAIIKYVPNVIVKWGRFVPNQEPHYDEVLGIYLRSDNQYAEKLC